LKEFTSLFLNRDYASGSLWSKKETCLYGRKDLFVPRCVRFLYFPRKKVLLICYSSTSICCPSNDPAFSAHSEKRSFLWARQHSMFNQWKRCTLDVTPFLYLSIIGVINDVSGG
jgi:hypothetical protein